MTNNKMKTLIFTLILYCLSENHNFLIGNFHTTRSWKALAKLISRPRIITQIAIKKENKDRTILNMNQDKRT